MKASGTLPLLINSKTLLRPARRAASTAATTCAGVVTGTWLTDMITKPGLSPLSEASLDGSTAVMITPRTLAGRFERRARSAVSGWSVSPSDWVPTVDPVAERDEAVMEVAGD